jgi:lysophospholipase L1-like esterase
MKNNINRRNFVKQVGVTALASMITADAFSSALPAPLDTDKTVTVLFQGDSITDGGRSYNKDWNHIMGQGYAFMIAGKLWYNHIDKPMMFYNRGISGNTIQDLLARWEPDTVSLKPDILSILIGVNDVYRVIHNQNPRTVEQFRSDYQQLLDQTKSELPDTKLVITEPFILPVGKVKENWERWQGELAPRQAIVQEVALQYNAVYIPLQESFLAATKKAPADYWIWDGLHPMPGGHQLIAEQWIKTVKKQLKFPS